MNYACTCLHFFFTVYFLLYYTFKYIKRFLDKSKLSLLTL
jgi:hypothetical protein